jgi:hypothetical protein
MTKSASAEATLTAGRIVTLDCHIRGIVPAIMSNGAMADPTYFWAKTAREIKKGVKRGEVMTEQQASLYYHALFVGQLYLLDGKSDPYWPAENVEGMIRRGAMKSQKGPTAKIAITVDDNFPLLYDGPKDAESLWADGDGQFVFKSRIGGKNGTTINCRCRFPVWEFKFSLLLDREQADASDVRRWLEDAGSYIGLSAWTPKYGRFEVVSVQ